VKKSQVILSAFPIAAGSDVKMHVSKVCRNRSWHFDHNQEKFQGSLVLVMGRVVTIGDGLLATEGQIS
jgi:hypothetical protein